MRSAARAIVVGSALCGALGLAPAQSTEWRYGMLADAAPYQVWPEGAAPGGADFELLGELARRAGKTLRPVRYVDRQRLEADLQAGQVDIASSMIRADGRDAGYAWTPAYARPLQGLLTRAEAPVTNLTPDLAGRSVAIVSGDASEVAADRLFPLASRVVVGNVDAAIDAVLGGRADATLQALPLLVDRVERRRVAGLQITRRFDLPAAALHFALAPGLRKDVDTLAALIAGLPPAQFEALLQRWAGRPSLLQVAGSFELSRDEQGIVGTLGSLRVALVGGARPFAFEGPQHQPVGLDVDVVDALARRLGLPPPAWRRLEAAELPEALRAGSVDLVVGLDDSGEWADSLRFIGPIIEHPMVLIGRPEGAAYDLAQLAGRRLALPLAHFGRPLIESRYAAIELLPCGELADCIERVVRGEADATLSDVVTAAVALTERQRGEVQIVGTVDGLVRTQTVGVATRQAGLLPLLQRGLDAVIASDLPALKERWLGRPSPADVLSRALRQVLPWVVASLALLALAWWWHSSALRREVRRTRAAQQQAERARGASERFVTFLAHEVRNSLHSVIAGAELLRSARQVTPAIAASLGDSARSTLNLLNNLLDRDRLEAGRLSLHLAPARLEPLLKSVAVEMLPAALAKQLVLQPVALNHDPLLRLDTLRVQQVVRNLVANAIKYSDAGAIAIEARCELLADAPRRCRIEIRVRDQGPGISAADQAHLFERYYVVGGRGSEQGSTGLGLPLCREIARLMGGDLALDSAPGRGTNVTLTWTADVESFEPTQAPAAPRRFLLVEDAEVYAMLLERALSVQGLPVAVASSVERARELLGQQAFDVVLTDLHLGDGDAHQVIAAARAPGDGGTPTIVVMSAEVEELQQHALHESGAQAVLKKSSDVGLFVRQLLQHPALQPAPT